jgi:amino acid adenylation domain-containing protein
MEPIVTRLRKLNIELDLADGKLKINGPKGAITAEVLEQIKAHKDFLIDYIRKARGQKKMTAIKPAEQKEYYKLSPAQRRLYVLYEFDKSSTAYNETQVLQLDGALDKEVIQKVFNQLAARHETLRTIFTVKNSEPVQIINDSLHVPVAFFKAEEDAVQNLIRDFVRAFDLNNGPLIRVGVIELSSTKHILIVDLHHIITDALSEGVLMSDFLSLYNNRPLLPLQLQYKDYAEWQQGKNRRQEIAKQKDFWLKEFEHPVQPLQLPTSFARPKVKGGHCERVQFHIPRQETKQLKEVAGSVGASPFMLLLALYNVLLGKLSHQEDIVVGIPMADRQHPALEKVLGIFINTLTLRNYPKFSSSFRQFLSELRSRALACFDHPAYPYDVLIEDLKIPRDSSRNPLFDVWFIYQNYEKIKFEHSGLSLHEYDLGRRESKFDIVLEAYEAGEQFHFNLSYANDLFTAERIDGFIGCLRELVKAIITNPDAKIGEIELFPLAADDATKLLADYTEDRIAPETILPASYHQERMWFVDKFESGFLYQAGPVYHNIPLIIDFKGNVNTGLLAQSLQQLLDTYSVLRTQLVTIDERPYQKIAAEAVLDIAIIKDEDEFLAKPFRLDEMLMRAALLQTGANSWRLVVTLHHSIADRFTVAQLSRKLLEIYLGRVLPSGLLSYAAFTIWQQEHLPERQFHLLAYWKQQLGPKLKALELPMDRPRAAIHIYKSATVNVDISAGTTGRLQRLAALHGVDLNALLMGAFTVLLQKYCRHEEIVIGTSADNRTAPCWQSLMGPASTLVVIRSFVSPTASFKDHVTAIAAIYAEAIRHQAMPFDLLVKELAPEKDMSRTALFDVLFQYEETKADLPEIPGVEVQVVETNLGLGKYDLNLLLQNGAQGINGKLVYNAEYFDPQTVEAFAAHYLQLIENILQSPGASIAALEITSEQEKQRLLHGNNNLNIAYPVNETITSLFRRQVQRTPENIAVKYNEETITYTELDKWSDQLAHVLREQGVLPDQVVGLLTGRSLETVAGMLAILKAGGAYLPIDVDYPEERINFLVADSGMKYILLSEEVRHTIPQHVSAIRISDEEIRSKEVAAIEEVNKPADICYVIYTSGTTGRPKGVMVEHRNVVRLFFNDAFQFDFDENDTWTMFHSHCFDFSVWEIYGALLFGGKVIIVPKIIAKDTAAYLQLLNKEQVTILNQTPSAFYNLAQEDLANAEADLNIRMVIFGGEALSPARLKEWHEKYPRVKLINMFGITETTVHVTYKEIGDHEIRNNISNVGKPIPTLSVFLFDEYMKLVPRGIIGELYVGGAGVSRGYLGNAELTAKKFIINPYNPGERLYRTGDLARVLHSGDIEYIGRIDHQVQLRGFRIELGEIESQLNNFPGIKESVAIARGNDDDKYLLAYYVSEFAIEAGELRKFLHDKLPDYMVPSHFIRVEKMPLTSNGKLDKQALPDPQITADEMHTGPANAIEEKLLEIWAEVLKLEPSVIGVNKSFFELGGHSLRATILINKISKEFQVSVALKDVFRNQDIISLARYINDARRESFAKVERAAEKEHYPLSSAQQRLFFLNEFDKSSVAYNLPHVVKLHGELDVEKLNHAFNKLIARHEVLRTSFVMTDGRPVQKISASVNFRVETAYDISSFVRPFDISAAPLIRAGLISAENILMVDMHHIIADGVSQTVLVNELAAFYRGESLAAPAIQYKDYAEWQQSGKQQLLIAKQKDFWVQQLANAPVLDLPTDHARPAVKTYAGAAINTSLDVTALHRIAKEEDTTLFMVLLAIYNVLLSNLSNQEDIVVGVPVAGRQHADFEHMIGMLVNTIALRNYPKGEISFKEFLRDVKSRSLAGVDNQAYPYEMLIDELKVVRDTGRNPLFDVMFMFHNFETAQPEMPGIRIEPYDWQPPVSKFDLTLVAREVDGQLLLTAEYSTELFEASTIERFIEYFMNIASAVTTDTNVKIADIDMLRAEERELLLKDFNDTYFDYPREATIVSIFEDQARRSPESIAVISGERQISYALLNKQANAIASHLPANTLIGLLLERDEYLLPCILAVLKAGSGYVPIDPLYPADRIKYVLEDSGIKLLLTSASLMQEHTSLNEVVQMVDVSTIDLTTTKTVTASINAGSTAYMIYTSGSTGRPKGVVISHSNVINFVHGTRRAVDFNHGSRMLCITTISFDIFVLESLLPLLSGMTVVLAGTEDQKDAQSLVQLITEQEVDFIQMTPSHVKLLLGSGRGAEVLANVKALMIGGEALPAELVQELHQHYKGKTYNMYGPTETTVWSCIGEVWQQITIGKPIANTIIRILSKHGKLSPLGVPGELCIGGEGVSKGYWHRPELTIEKFITDKWGAGKLYRTGDLAKWRTDGQLVCLGRIDQQVKIRGHRIEPGEIEAQLNQHPGIMRSAVDAKGQGSDKYLVAYYESTTPIDAADLRAHLAGILPAYMVPAYFMQLEKLPLTPNGKLDRKALPDPQIITGNDYVAPTNTTEERLIELWSEALHLDRSVISVNKSFFELGGHSLIAMLVNARIQQEFEVKIQLTSFFQRPTISELSRTILVARLARKAHHTVDKITI